MEDTSPKPRRRTWLRVLIGLSFATNLIILGAVVGALAFGDGPRKEARSDVRNAGRLPMVAMLPKEAREGMRAEIGAAVPRKPDRNAQRREMAMALDQLLRADPFDPAAMADLLAQRRDQRGARAEAVDIALVSAVAGLSAEDRVAFADRLRKRGRKHH